MEAPATGGIHKFCLLSYLGSFCPFLEFSIYTRTYCGPTLANWAHYAVT